MEIGQKIRQLRYKTSLTQEQLADRLGLSAQAVSKWENAITMPDIALLPALAEVFGVSIDELFDLTAEQKCRRIEGRLNTDEELEPAVFREYEVFLMEQLDGDMDIRRVCSLLAQLYHHRLEACAKKVRCYAREAIRLSPGEKDCQWLLQKAEGSAVWDWNAANHAKTIDFYRGLIADGSAGAEMPLPYYDLLDNLIADCRTREAREVLTKLSRLPKHKPFLIPVYEAAILLAECKAQQADAVMENALKDFPCHAGLLFEAAQHYARRCEYEKAIQYYEASYAAEGNNKPRYTDALQGVATIHEIRGQYEKAADVQRRILYALKHEWGFTEETVIRETEREIERLTRE